VAQRLPVAALQPLEISKRLGKQQRHGPGLRPRLAPATAPSYLPPIAARRGTRMPKPLASAEDTDAMVARVAPAVLALLADGVPRSRRAIVAALADRHPKDEVRHALMRLAVTGGVEEVGSRYVLATPENAAQP
jgi:hypothetical protein